MNCLFTGRKLSGKSKSEVLSVLGQLLEITAKLEDGKKINIESFLHWIKPAILHDQYLILKRDGDIEPSGYILWAWVNVKTLEEYFTKDCFALNPMSWNEGEHLIIVDFAISDYSNMYELYRRCRNKTGISYKWVNISIRNSAGLVIKNNRRRAL